MRLLLAAYDFAPIPSPQALRWIYLVRELAALGHEIHVLTVDLPGYGPGGLPPLPDTVTIHRAFPGPFSAFLFRRQRRLRAGGDGQGRQPGSITGQAGAVDVALNWKGRLAERLKRLLSGWMFPDYRAEWLPWARRRLNGLLRDFGPDVVVTSHEPACALPLGLIAKRNGFRWVVDLGDPVLAPYTPRHWRRRASMLERKVCQNADLISVTTSATAALLCDRHGLPAGRFLVIPQGYDETFNGGTASTGTDLDKGRLELLYTGSLYSFRRADALLDAVVRTPGVRLNIATSVAPDYVLAAAANHPESIRLLGFIPHLAALELQRRCDVLVNLANDNPVQIPGKVNEYIGAGRPILHIQAPAGPDAVADMIDQIGLGWHVAGEVAGLSVLLAQLHRTKLAGTPFPLQRNEAAAARYSWRHLAQAWSQRAECLLPGSAPRGKAENGTGPSCPA